ncbi:MAG: histidinol-phosphatase [Candidatus Delongbacteria bacterium]|nr:histidinol-phosphatase [Candidatus Delongbacteria bacterium]MBN2835207.1 histidinol-phosphatase [Candidatus Delongbacteria bacterium]
MKKTNYHTHSIYSDGKFNLKENIESAISNNLHILGFSDHCPLPFDSSWAMKLNDYDTYINEINELKIQYQEKIKILAGLELDYIPEIIDENNKFFDTEKLDYVIGSIHLLGDPSNGELWSVDHSFDKIKNGCERDYQGNFRTMVEDYYRRILLMAENTKPDIIGHLDLVKIRNTNNRIFNENESWYLDAVYNALISVKANDCIVEINTGGVSRGYTDSFYPSDIILKIINELKIPVMINSDAHRIEHICGKFEEAFEKLKLLGFTELVVIDINGRNFQKL